MIFSLEKATLLREVLKIMKASEGVSLAGVLQLVVKAPGGWGGVGALSISDLSRFNNGTIPGKKGLRFARLLEVLEGNDALREIVHEAKKSLEPKLADEMLARFIPHFFGKYNESGKDRVVANLRKRLAGRYTMYRPALNSGYRTGFYMSSLIEIIDAENSMCIFEQQDHRQRDTDVRVRLRRVIGGRCVAGGGLP